MFRLPSIAAVLARLDDSTVPRMQHATVTAPCPSYGYGHSYGYGIVDGAGDTVVLLHGWGLAHGSYRRPAEAIAAAGFRVVVPDLPGFGMSVDLPLAGLTMRAYARCLGAFLERCRRSSDETVHLVGHSFGGAVAAQLAHDRPDLVASVVLVSSLGSDTWLHDGTRSRPLAERPLWDWGVHLVHEFPRERFPVAALEVLRDLSNNLIHHLPTMGAVAHMITRSDLSDGLSSPPTRSLPYAVVRARDDHVVTQAGFEDQCRRLGVSGTVVEGNHAWPIGRPASFGATIGDIIRTMATSAPGHT